MSIHAQSQGLVSTRVVVETVRDMEFRDKDFDHQVGLQLHSIFKLAPGDAVPEDDVMDKINDLADKLDAADEVVVEDSQRTAAIIAVRAMLTLMWTKAYHEVSVCQLEAELAPR